VAALKTVCHQAEPAPLEHITDLQLV